MIHQTCMVETKDHAYPIYIGQSIYNQTDLIVKHIPGQEVLIVSQEPIAKYYLTNLIKSLEKLTVNTYLIPEGEQYKNITTWIGLIECLIKHQYERKATLIAFGGGITGDVTGFAAACYLRGINYIQIPTSLIAQCDAAIGGKTGVNHALGKNLIGSFHQPDCVIVDVELLKTLSEREFIAGLAEVVKYGLIYDAQFFDWIESNIQKILQKNTATLIYILRRCITIKAEIVSKDEKESDLRAILNFGHTFGHAIETILGYQTILHGEAVAIGMILAAQLSEKLLGFSYKCTARIIELLKSIKLLKLANKIPTVDALIPAIMHDKKKLNGRIQMILLEKIGLAKKTTIDNAYLGSNSLQPLIIF